jgi:hypothetical protein
MQTTHNTPGNGRFPRWAGVLLFVFLLPTPTRASESETLIAIEGDPSLAKLLQCKADGSWLFEIEGKPHRWTADQWIRWGAPAKTQSGPYLYLSGGSCLAVDEGFGTLEITEDRVTVDSKSLGEKIELPLTSVEGIIFRPSPDLQQRNQIMDRFREMERTTDTVLLDNGDELQGTIHGLTATTGLTLQTVPGDTISVPRKNIVALVLNPALVDRPKHQDQLLLVHFADGSRVMASDWKGDEEKLEMVSPTGQQFSAHYRKDRRDPNLIGLQSFVPQVVYLSDLEPADYRHRPYLSVHWPYQTDRNVIGTRLQSGGTLYEKGIGMHSVASLTYRLEKPYQRFDATLGIDDSAGNRGSVLFRLYVDDGSGKWQLREQSEILRGGDGTRRISIDLTGIRGLSLVVDHADRGDEMDRANWLDARLLRATDQ